MPVEVEKFEADSESVDAEVATGCVVGEVLCEPLLVVPEAPPVGEPDGLGVPVVEVPPELVVPLAVVEGVVPVPPVAVVPEALVPEALVPEALVPEAAVLLGVELAAPVPLPVPLAGVLVDDGVVTTP
jgi:hypothetical protein